MLYINRMLVIYSICTYNANNSTTFRNTSILGNIYFIHFFSLLFFGQGYLAQYLIKVDEIFQR